MTERKLFSELPLKERIRLARAHVARPDSDYMAKQEAEHAIRT